MSIAAMTGIAQVLKTIIEKQFLTGNAIFLIPEMLSGQNKNATRSAVWRSVSRVQISSLGHWPPKIWNLDG